MSQSLKFEDLLSTVQRHLEGPINLRSLTNLKILSANPDGEKGWYVVVSFDYDDGNHRGAIATFRLGSQGEVLLFQQLPV